MACCRCCEKTGACCNDGVCTEETCADCEAAGGVFQGVDTTCVSGDCPCDPPADPSLCQKCVDGSAESYCPEDRPNCCDGVCQECCDAGDCSAGQYCCDGVCQAEECAPVVVPCDSDADCATAGLTCEEIVPGYPEQCCDGECEEMACYPDSQVTMNFTKKAGCTAGFLAGVAEGDPFSVVVSGGSLTECGVTSAEITAAVCFSSWTVSEGCEISDVQFATGGDPTCEACYEFVDYSACRTDCSGACL